MSATWTIPHPENIIDCKEQINKELRSISAVNVHRYGGFNSTADLGC